MTHEEHDTEFENQIIETVAKHGWQVSMIESDGYNPSFAYTIGLTKTYGHPELIIMGLGIQVMNKLLNIAGNLIKIGHTIQLNNDYDNFIKGYQCQFIQMHKAYYSDYLGYGIWFNKGQHFDTYQLVWPNKTGHFPWNKGDDELFDFWQPLLDRKVDFKYLEPEYLAIYTTQYVMNLEKPILEVYHDKDGDWQFLCGTTNHANDLRVVGLKQIVEMDNSVNELFNLGLGEYAWRESLNDEWERELTED